MALAKLDDPCGGRKHGTAEDKQPNRQRPNSTLSTVDSTVVPRNIINLKMTLNKVENGSTETTSTFIFMMDSIL